MIDYKPPWTFITGVNMANCYMNCLTLWEKGMLRGSHKTFSSSVVCKGKPLCVFRLPTLLPSIYFLLGLAGRLLMEENDYFMSIFNRIITYSQDLYTCISKVYTLMNFYKMITPKESVSRIKYRTWPFHAIFQSHPAPSWGYHCLDSNITNWFCHVFVFHINGIIQYDLLFVWCLLLNIMFVNLEWFFGYVFNFKK